MAVELNQKIEEKDIEIEAEKVASQEIGKLVFSWVLFVQLQKANSRKKSKQHETKLQSCRS
jgi:hypothetical protein